MDKVPQQSAFPVDYDAVHDSGISILDYFAARALPAVIALVSGWEVKEDATEESLEEIVAAQTYLIARAMMKEREKHQ